jgi:hypothetical protein
MTATKYNEIQSRNIYPNRAWAIYCPEQKETMIPPP